MIQFQVKLYPNAAQVEMLKEWFNIGAGIYNWALRKIELDGRDGLYYGQLKFVGILSGHAQKTGVPDCLIQGMLRRAWRTWRVCFKANKGVHPSKWAQPKFKTRRSPLTSLPLSHPKSVRVISRNKLRIFKLGEIGFRSGEIPTGKIKCGAILREPSGYYLCLFIDRSPQKLACQAGEMIGIDPGFKDLLNLSNGEKLNGPDELATAILKTEARIKQAARGRDWKLVRRLNEKLRNQKKLRNHVVSKDLVQRFETIAFGVDNEAAMAKTRKVKNKSGQRVKRKGFGASVARNTHYQLRQMVKYKAEANKRQYLEVDGKNTTRRCSHCFELTGPTGLAGLSVREWICSTCDTPHERDINAATNILLLALNH